MIATGMMTNPSVTSIRASMRSEWLPVLPGRLGRGPHPGKALRPRPGDLISGGPQAEARCHTPPVR
ncbi:hypothetical protein GCM10010289_17290 [Streptomyces violascens]|uniref:Uncharacterized protein n=1 Tax=Streptomyces violascens TaxID=67381 RepID=A0ABQ3QIX6_9ACTN|nr:hypothetical protein GCM10010289_17290 [Streptomyces violascens]GHI37223.1 hypothetical protein Sviol_16310 [Streptomyces violascens]